jgi:hypothetical protein
MVKLFVFILLFVVFHALGDSTMNDRKRVSHLFRSLSVASALGMVLVYRGSGFWDGFVMVSLYCVNRFFLFDPVYNVSRVPRLALSYIGDTGWWDINVQRVLLRIKMPWNYWFWIKFCVWVTGNGWILYNYSYGAV